MVESDTQQFEQLRCVQCGYLLRGLDRTGKCPECGLEIEESVLGDHLSNSGDLAWLKNLHRGSLFLVLGIAGLLMSSCLYPAVLDTISCDKNQYTTWLAMILIVVFCGFMLLLCSGVLLLTCREEVSYFQRKNTLLRQMARVTALLTALSFFAVLMNYYHFVDLRFEWLFQIFLIAFVWSFMLYMSSLAFRAKTRFLIFVSKLIAWGVPGLALLAVILSGNFKMIFPVGAGELFLAILLLVVSLGFLEEFSKVLRMHHERFTPEAENRRDESS